MASPQRRALGTLFVLICVSFLGIAYAAIVSGAGARGWIIAAAAVGLAAWMGSLAVQMLRRR